VVFYANDASTNVGDWRRRVSRTATLDGGVAVTDSGFTHADRTLTIGLQGQTQATVDQLRSLCALHSAVIVMLSDGAYRAVPESVSVSGNRAVMTVLLTGDAVLS
jgi:hypothetical protein